MRRVLAVCAAAVIVGGGLVGIGRWEQDRFVRTQNEHLRLLSSAVGPIANKRVVAWRVTPTTTCFWYLANGKPYGLSLCFDPVGRLVSGADRRSGSPIYWDLGTLRSRAATQVRPRLVRSLAARLRHAALELTRQK